MIKKQSLRTSELQSGRSRAADEGEASLEEEKGRDAHAAAASKLHHLLLRDGGASHSTDHCQHHSDAQPRDSLGRARERGENICGE